MGWHQCFVVSYVNGMQLELKKSLKGKWGNLFWNEMIMSPDQLIGPTTLSLTAA